MSGAGNDREDLRRQLEDLQSRFYGFELIVTRMAGQVEDLWKAVYEPEGRDQRRRKRHLRSVPPLTALAVGPARKARDYPGLALALTAVGAGLIAALLFLSGSRPQQAHGHRAVPPPGVASRSPSLTGPERARPQGARPDAGPSQPGRTGQPGDEGSGTAMTTGQAGPVTPLRIQPARSEAGSGGGMPGPPGSGPSLPSPPASSPPPPFGGGGGFPRACLSVPAVQTRLSVTVKHS